jgi:hypothetical protein
MILVPATSLDDWQRHGAEPGAPSPLKSSTRALASRWHEVNGLPREIANLLADTSALRDPRLLLAVPEHQVPLAGGTRASPVDLWLLARTSAGLMSVVVEGNSTESFGPTLDDVPYEGMRERWAALCRLLEIDRPCDTSIRYRLFHGTASALLEARRFFARSAALIVHCFSEPRDSFGDFQHFVGMMGGQIDRPGQLIQVAPREDITLLFGWAQGPIWREMPADARS